MAIRDMDDLLRQLREHPEWRDALRRELASEDMLALPGIVRELAEAQQRTEERLAALTERVDALAGRMDALTARVDDLAAKLAVLTERVDALTGQMERLVGRVGRMDGQLYELRYRDKAAGRFQRVLRRIHVVSSEELGILPDPAEDRLTELERDRLFAADLVLRGVSRRDGQECYLVAEGSVGLGVDDVQRAAERAEPLTKALGVPAMAAVSGESIDREGRETADRLGVAVVLEAVVQEAE